MKCVTPGSGAAAAAAAAAAADNLVTKSSLDNIVGNLWQARQESSGSSMGNQVSAGFRNFEFWAGIFIECNCWVICFSLIRTRLDCLTNPCDILHLTKNCSKFN